MTKLETERLVLNELTAEDAEFTLALLNDPAFIENIGDREIRSLEQAEQYLQDRVTASYRENGFGMYAVRLKTTGETLGMSGLVKRESFNDIDIGYGFLPRARGHGYALESAKEVMRWAINDLKLDRLVAIVGPQNKPSISLLENLGMHFESMIRLPDDEEEICLFGWNAAE